MGIVPAVFYYSIQNNNTANSTVLGHRQFRVTFKKTYIFFPKDTVFRIFDYPVIFPNLLAALNLMLAI